MHVRKIILYSLLVVVIIAFFWQYLTPETYRSRYIQGETMGTSYHIIYLDSAHRDFNKEIDDLLKQINQSVSTYILESEITQYNTKGVHSYQLPYFFPILSKAKKVVELSQGAFDPTVMPLVNAWGFGFQKKKPIDTLLIDSIRTLVGFDKIRFNRDSVWNVQQGVQLDFSAIAKGYGVDVVVDSLLAWGVNDLFVEIGGEVSTRGKNSKLKNPWRIGILHPDSSYDAQSYIAYVELHNQAIATSGNYFNYYYEGGKKYTHILDPKTGYPARRNILSASVFAQDCATADAWATAFMVMGHQKAIALLKTSVDIDAFLVYDSLEEIRTFATDGIKPFLTINR